MRMYVCKRVHLKKVYLKKKRMYQSSCAAFADVLFFMPLADFFFFVILKT